MTTLTNNQNEQLFADLTSEVAEALEGGHSFNAYGTKYGKFQKLAAANNFIKYPKDNNKYTWLHIKSGNWRVYDLPGFKGAYRDFKKPGWYKLRNIKWIQNGRLFGSLYKDISSFKKIA